VQNLHKILRKWCVEFANYVRRIYSSLVQNSDNPNYHLQTVCLETVISSKPYIPPMSMELLSQGLLTCLITVYPMFSIGRLGVANSIIRVLIVSLL